MSIELSTPKGHRDRYLVLLSLVASAFLLVMLVDFGAVDSLTEDVLMIGVTILTAATLVAALWTAAAKTRWVGFAVALGCISSLAAMVAAVTDGSYQPSLLWVLMLLLAPVVVVRRLMSHGQVTSETILGAICAYLLIALAFSYVYLLIDSTASTFFFGTAEPSTAFPYFSLVTITTLGYGDLAPATEPARALATTEALIGQIFLVVFVARIVSLYAGEGRKSWSKAEEASTV